jgi:hypothetical protein
MVMADAAVTAQFTGEYRNAALFGATPAPLVVLKLPEVPTTAVLLWSRTASVCVPTAGAAAEKLQLPPTIVGLEAAFHPALSN